MTRPAKVGVVLAGYVAAFIAAIVASRLYNARVSTLPYDTSGGMYAAGEMLSALAAFLLVALAPIALALWFLRSHKRFWNAVAVLSLAFVGIGLVSVLLSMGTHGTATYAPPIILGILGLTHLLGAPLWAVAFAIFAFLAPTRPARRLLLFALGAELVIGALAFLHWFVPGSRV